MESRLPKGELRWLAVIWLLICGLGLPFAIYHVLILEILICAFMLPMTLGICYGSRGCAKTLLVMFALSGAVILVREVIMAGNYMRLDKIMINGYFVYALYDWLKREDD